MPDYCKGCAVFICFYRMYNAEKGDCPCTNCLVKVVCDDGEKCSMWQAKRQQIGMKMGKVRHDSELL